MKILGFLFAILMLAASCTPLPVRAGDLHFQRYIVGLNSQTDTYIERTTDGLSFTDFTAGTVKLWELASTAGDITGVTAGNGLTGGGLVGGVTLDVGSGAGIWTTATQVGVDASFLANTGLQAAGGKLSVIYGTTAGTAAAGNDSRLGVSMRLFDAVVAPSGGDYTLISTAIAAGAASIYVKEGTYSESTDINVPDGGIIVGENSIIDFQNQAYSIRVVGTRAYSTGTISVSHNATAVTGAGTDWYPVNLQAGDVISLGNAVYTISAVLDDTHLTLATPYTGTALSGASYQGGDYATATIANIIAGDPATVGFYAKYTRDLKLVNCGSTSGTTGASLNYSLFPRVDGFEAIQPATTGIHTLQAPGVEIVNSLTSGGNYGVYATGNNTSVKNCLVEGALVQGIYINGTGALIEGGTVGNCLAGIGLSATSTGGKILDVSFDNNGTDIHATTYTADPVIVLDHDYSDISGNDDDTDVTGAELETLSDGSYASLLHIHHVDPPGFQQDTGNEGDYAFDATYFFICRAANSWERLEYATWATPPPTPSPTAEKTRTPTPTPTVVPAITPTPAELRSIVTAGWNATTTWDQTRIPTINDRVILSSGYTVTLSDQTAAAGAIDTYLTTGVNVLVIEGAVDIELGDSRESMIHRGLNLNAGPDLTLWTSGTHTIFAEDFTSFSAAGSVSVKNIKLEGLNESRNLVADYGWTVETDSSMTLSRVYFAVQTGGELVLQPGSTLTFDCYTDLDSRVYVQGGTLTAEGTAAERITINSDSTTMAVKTGSIFCNSALTMDYCDVSYLGYAPDGWAGIWANGGTYDIQNSYFEYCRGALRANNADVTFSNNTTYYCTNAFRSDNGLAGAEISGNVFSYSQNNAVIIGSPSTWYRCTGLNIEANTIHNSGQSGIYLNNVETSAIHRNRVHHNNYHGIACYGSRADDIEIKNNESYLNSMCNIYLNGGSDYFVRFNTLDACGPSWAGIGVANSADDVAIAGNIITQNYYGIANLDSSAYIIPSDNHNVLYGNTQNYLYLAAFVTDTVAVPVYERTADQYYYRISYYQSPATGFTNYVPAGEDIIEVERPSGGVTWDAGAWEVDETKPTPTPTVMPTPTVTPTATPTVTPTPSTTPTPVA